MEYHRDKTFNGKLLIKLFIDLKFYREIVNEID